MPLIYQCLSFCSYCIVDTDPVKEVGSEGETRLGVRDRRKGRRERRSTGVVQLGVSGGTPSYIFIGFVRELLKSVFSNRLTISSLYKLIEL